MLTWLIILAYVFSEGCGCVWAADGRVYSETNSEAQDLQIGSEQTENGSETGNRDNTSNYASIVNNTDDLYANFGSIVNNTNTAGIKYNFGSVSSNSGSIEYNYGTVKLNTGSIKNNYGKVILSNNAAVSGNQYHKVSFSNEYNCLFTIDSMENRHVINTAEEVEVEGTADIQKTDEGYVITAKSDIKIHIYPKKAYSVNVDSGHGGRAYIADMTGRILTGDDIATGSALQVIMQADSGFRCASMTITSEELTKDEVTSPTDVDIQYYPYGISEEDYQAVILGRKTVDKYFLTPIWDNGIPKELKEAKAPLSYQWQRSTEWEFDDYWGEQYGVAWEDVEGATDEILILDIDQLYDPDTYDYTCDYRLLITADNRRYCTFSLLGGKYSPTDTEMTDTVRRSSEQFIIDNYSNVYQKTIIMSDATMNIACEFEELIGTDVTVLDFGTVSLEYSVPEAKTLTISTNAGTGAVYDNIGARLYYDNDIGFDILNEPSCEELNNNGSTTVTIRPQENLPYGAYEKILEIPVCIGESKFSQYIILKFEVSGLRPKLEALTASDITYGQKLGESTINGRAIYNGHDLTGTFRFETPDEVPSVRFSTAYKYAVIFTPEDSGNYAKGYGEVYVKVKPAVLTVTTESAEKQYDGTPLTAGGNISGLVGNETVTFNITGEQTEEGTSVNSYEIVWDGKAEKTNYQIKENLGYLTVVGVGTLQPEEPGQEEEPETPGSTEEPEEPGREEEPETPGSTEEAEEPGQEEEPETPGSTEEPEIPYIPMPYIPIPYTPVPYIPSVQPTSTIQPEQTDGDSDDEGINQGENTKQENIADSDITDETGKKTDSGQNGDSGDVSSETGSGTGESENKNNATEESDSAKLVVKKLDYKNVSKKNKTISCSGNEGETSVSIPATVKVDGVKLKVISVSESAFKGNSEIETVSVGKNVLKIYRYAFQNCKNLETADLSKNVSLIGKYTFAGCNALQNVKLSDSLTYIGGRAFKNCKSLKALNIPSKVNYIGKNAFYGCKKLKKLIITSELLNSKNVAANAFGGVSKNAVIYVPADKLKAYTKLFRKKGLSETVQIKAL